MSDGSIKIAVEVDGKQVDVASKSLDNLESSGQEAGQGVKQAEDGLKGVGNESNKASGNVKKFATALGLVALGAAAFNILKSSMDAAISRFDTLNTFPKVLQELGVSAEDSERAMSNLSDGIDGLPTKLDEIAGNAQRMYTTFDDMDKATDSALALNNALLGSGSSSADAQRGAEQYIKYLQTGKMEMDTWTTLQETMDVALIKVAESFGYTGRTAKTQLYSALQEGTITMDQFNDKMIELGTGTGVMAKLAKENSLGIATSWGNLQNAFSRGTANILEKFNNLSKEVTGKEIAGNIDSLKNIVNASFNLMGKVIDATTPIVKAFASVIKMTIPIVKTLTPAIAGLMTAYAAYTVITKVAGAINASNAVLAVATTSTKTLTLATRAQIATTVLSTNATKAEAAATVAKTGAVKLSAVVTGVLTGAMKLSTAAMIIKTSATYALSTALKFLSGPIGWVTVGIGAIATAAIAVVKWFKRTTEEANRLNAETEQLGESSNSLVDSLKQTEEAYAQNIKDTEASAKANEMLAEKVEKLASKENKSAAEKQLLNDYIGQLNESVDGLNLAYDEEANKLSVSSKELQTRIGLMGEQTSYNDALERQVEIMEEQVKVEEQLEGTNKLREEWNQKLEEGTVKSGEHKDAIAELDEQEATLKQTLSELTVQQAETEAQITSSTEAITEATQSGIASQKLAYEDLSEAQQKAVDNMKNTWESYKDAATDMFDTISTKSEISVAEMTKNLETNQKIIGDWAEGIATLAERGVDEGLLETLRAAGPESAGHVNALVNASDKELEKLSEAFSNGGETATEALGKSLGIENSNLLDSVSNLVVDTEQSLMEQIQAADFESIGVYLPEGLASGVEKGKGEAEKATKKMAEDTTRAAKHTLGIHSPSRVFKEVGANIADGLVLGINGGTSRVVQAINKMFKSVEMDSTRSFQTITRNYDRSVMSIGKSLDNLPRLTQIAMRNMLNRLRAGASQQVQVMRTLASNLRSPFNSTPSQFRSIGLNSMAGLNSGLNAGSGRVMATARGIANRVASTMRSALRIHSPSRLMRDDVGKMIPAGIALGIRDNAKSVYDEINKLSSGMIMTSTPETALGTNRMAYNAGSQFVDAFKNIQMPSTSTDKSVDPEEKQPAIINVHVGSKQVASEIVDDITNLQNRKSNRKRRYPKGGGAFA